MKDGLEKNSLWQKRFEKIMKKSRKYFQKWLVRRGVDLKNLTEEKVYELIRTS